MVRKAMVFASAALLVAGAAYAGPGKGKKAAKLTDVMVCPISGKAATDTSVKTEKVGKYMVHFCCPNCQPGFDKLSAKQKQQKIAEALKKSKKTSSAAPAAKLVVLNYCPMTGEAVHGAAGGSEIVGNYKVQFCCAGCKPQFDKLSTAERDQKIAASLKKG